MAAKLISLYNFFLLLNNNFSKTQKLAILFFIILSLLYLIVCLPNGKKYQGLSAELDYCVWYNFTQAEGLTNLQMLSYTPITLAVHSTSNVAYQIKEQVQNWDDFVSFAILMPKMRVDHAYVLQKLHFCEPNVKNKVSFHLVWMDSINNCSKPRYINTDVINCKDLNSSVSIMQKEKAYQYPYPINLQRFVARKGAATNIHIVADVENRFSNKFAKLARKEAQLLLKPDTEKQLLVFRRFEYSVDAELPMNMLDTYWMHQGRLMFEFHHFIFSRGHEIANLTEWMIESIFNDTGNAIQMTFDNPSWEPQFIMNGNAPYHLINVPTRIRDHQTLVNELCRAGYTLKLLPNVYNAHKGIKKFVSAYDKAVTWSNVPVSYEFFHQFNEYLDEKYPSSKGECPTLRNWYE